ncbi:exported hypothetical protein [uncultured delta proteobacterium]|uniref:Uncharacterized protein n=1 Tax=uncultured delta proteobacterium TaxID=34034 RepID=A0A212JNU1_9DELT|nr:exported hypothetical protein [uncultured delta proteobacterium]
MGTLFKSTPSRPALRGCLFAVPLNAKTERQLLHEKDTHAGRPALFSYVRTRSGARAARTTG